MIRLCDVAIKGSSVKYYGVHIFSTEYILFRYGFLCGKVGGNGEIHVVWRLGLSLKMVFVMSKF